MAIYRKANRKILKFDPLTYGYSNARIRAMRPHLLSKKQAEDLLKIKTNAAVAEYLSRTAYGQDFANMPHDINDEERIDMAVSKNFARTMQKILKIAPEENRDILLAFLARYDIHNIKAILFSKSLSKSNEEIHKLLIPAGSIRQESLKSMIEAKNPNEFYSLLQKSDFGSRFLSSSLAKGISKEKMALVFSSPQDHGKELAEFIHALDVYYYKMVSEVVCTKIDKETETVFSLLKTETDSKNIITAMRLKKNGAGWETIMKHMVDGGNFTRKQLEEIAKSQDAHAIVSAVSKYFISNIGKEEFATAEERFKKDGQISHFEVVFERAIGRKSLKALRHSMMSIGAIVGFLLLKEEEMNNIHKIVRAKTLGVPEDKVAEMLVFAN